MKKVFKFLIPAAALCLSSVSFDSSAACVGKFPNPITDYCWDCIFPIVIGGPIGTIGNGWGGPTQEDYNSGVSGTLCTCPSNSPLVPPRAGIHVSFWSLDRQMDVTRTPYCMVSLGGTDLNININTSLTGADTPGNIQSSEAKGNVTFRQTHWYISPWLVIMQVILADNCLSNVGFDVGYMSEVDPTTDDEALDRMLNPEDYLLGGIIADATCVIDAVQADITFPNQMLWWCDGTNGPTGNTTGMAPNNYGAVQASTRYIHKTAQKLFRLGTESAASGPNGMCGYFPQIIMDKREWKYSMIYPVPQSHPDPVFGHCCQPLGRSTILWGAGRSYPIQGEDFAYALYRKRDCCQSAPGTP